MPGLGTVLHRHHCVFDAGLGTLDLADAADAAATFPGSFLWHK